MEENRGTGWLGLTIGVSAGLFVGGLLGVVVGHWFIMSKQQETLGEWNLVHAVTASEDISECTIIEMKMIQQQPIPEQFVTESVVRPDSVDDIIGKAMGAPVKEGDPILWALVEDPFTCGERGARTQEADEEAAAGDWNLVKVVTASEDISECTTVEMDMLERRAIPEQFVTGSFVRPDSIHYIVGVPASVPLNKGDPILWYQFGKPFDCDEASSTTQDED